MGVFSFRGYLYPFFVILFIVPSFDKMQIPYTMKSIAIYPSLYLVCLATTGICVFVR